MCSEQFPRIWLAAVLGVVALALTGCPRPTWTRVFGGAGEDQFHGVAAANDGGFLLAGRTRSYGAGEADMYVVKLKAGGGTDWVKTYGTAGTETAFSVAAASTGGYLLAGCTHPASEPGADMYAVKIDASGTVEWTNTYGGEPTEEAFSVIATSNGGYLLSGKSYSADGTTMLVVHADASGVQQWSSTVGSPSVSTARCAVESGDGGYLLAGEALTDTTEGFDMCAVKTNGLGEPQWSNTYGDPGSDRCYGVVATSDGGYLLAGESNPPTPPVFAEVYLVKINSTGGLQWSKTFGGSGANYGARSIIATSDGGYLVAGRGAGNLYTLKLDASGNGQWSSNFGGYQGEIAEDALQAGDGGYVLAGSTWSYHASHLSGWDEGYVVKADSWGHGSSDPTH